MTTKKTTTMIPFKFHFKIHGAKCDRGDKSSKVKETKEKELQLHRVANRPRESETRVQKDSKL